MSRYSVVRLLETFFRRWWLYLVPFVLLCALGAASVVTAPPEYRSVGTLTVTKTSLGDSVGSDPGFGYDSPAIATAKQMASQLKTEVFLKDVANRARLGQLVEQNVITLEKIQQSISPFADGTSLLHVAAVFDDPAVAQLLVQATVDAFTQSVIDANTADSLATAEFYDGLVVEYQAEVDRLRQLLDQYLIDHPSPGFGVTRPDDEAAQIARLTSDVTAADTKYQSAAGRAEEARLKTEVTKAEVGRRYILTDAPKVPDLPTASTKTMAMQVMVFAAIGLLLSLTAVVVAATFDHSIRFASDLRERTGLRVLAVVPRSRDLAHEGARLAKDRRKRRRGEPDEAPTRERIVARPVPHRTVAPARATSSFGSSEPDYGDEAAAAAAPAAPHTPPAAPAARTERPAARPAAGRPEPYYAPDPAAPRQRPAAERPAAPPRQRPAAERPVPGRPAASTAPADRGWSAGRRPRTDAPAPAAGGTGTNGAAGPNGDREPSGWPPRRRGGRPGDIPHAS